MARSIRYLRAAGRLAFSADGNTVSAGLEPGRAPIAQTPWRRPRATPPARQQHCRPTMPSAPPPHCGPGRPHSAQVLLCEPGTTPSAPPPHCRPRTPPSAPQPYYGPRRRHPRHRSIAGTGGRTQRRRSIAGQGRRHPRPRSHRFCRGCRARRQRPHRFPDGSEVPDPPYQAMLIWRRVALPRRVSTSVRPPRRGGGRRWSALLAKDVRTARMQTTDNAVTVHATATMDSAL